jgi:diguanylate cyclase (GGDEF)-like protein
MDKQDKTQSFSIIPVRRFRERPSGELPVLVVMAGQDMGKVFYFDEEGKTIGRDVEVQIPLTDSLVSRRHAQVYRQKAEDHDDVHYVIVDLHSTNGTFVNGERISKAFLHAGDKIQIGNTTLKFNLQDEAEHRFQIEIERRIRLDDLTGLLSINFFNECLERRLNQARRRQSKVTVLMMDLDSLKSVNEKHGHLAGSFMIKSVAALLREQLGPVGEVGRYGGDEFIAFIPDLETGELLRHLEDLRSAIEERRFSFKGVPVRITVSVGLAVYPRDGETVEELVAAADAALFSAKEQGKNRVAAYDSR